MSNKKQIKITPADLKKIYGKDYHFFKEKIIPNAFCPHGDKLTTTIVNYEIFEYGNTSTLLGVDVNPPPVAMKISAKDVQLINEELDPESVNEEGFTDINKDGYYERDYYYGDPIDVDNDGIKEDVISVQTIVMNHGASEKLIIKNNRIIFKSGVIAGNIKPSKSNNGFYLNEMIDSGTLFGVGGGRTTRYIYEQGKFIPVWYQDHFDLQTTEM